MKRAITIFSVIATFFCLAAEDAAWLTETFPKQLITASGKKVDTETALKGKTVAVYFSASWCGPCRSFTPELVKFHKKAAKKEKLEIVFVSSDKTSKAMMDYMKKDFLQAGVDVIVPDNADRELIAKRIYEELEVGIVKKSTLQEFNEIIKKKEFPTLSTRPEEDLVSRISSHFDSFYSELLLLEQSLERYPSKATAKERAFYSKDHLLASTEKLRDSADAIELLIGKQFLPYPSYEDILYSVKY